MLRHRQLRLAADLAQLPNKRPALDVLEGLLADDPDDAVALGLYCACLRAIGRFTDAHQAASRALELEPESSQALAQMGWTVFVMGRDKDAGLCADAAIAADPTDESGWWLRAEWALFTQRFSKAEAAARELVAMEPASALAHALLGRALLAQGATSRARSALEEALRLDPDDGLAREALAAVVVAEARGGADRRPAGPLRRSLRALMAHRPGGAANVRARRVGGVLLLLATLALSAGALAAGRPGLAASMVAPALALWLWAPIALDAGAPPYARWRGALAFAGLVPAVALAWTLPGASLGALLALALWSVLRAALQTFGLGRTPASLAAEIDPTFGVDPGGYKVDAGYRLLDAGECRIARVAFRAVLETQDYSPAAACGRRLAAAPEWMALFPSAVSPEAWRRAPTRLCRMRNVVSLACALGFALGVFHMAEGRPWPALLHSSLVALGGAFAATALDVERRAWLRPLYWITGVFIAAWPLLALAESVRSLEALEAAVWVVFAARFLASAGDLGERFDKGTDPDPRSGDRWAS